MNEVWIFEYSYRDRCTHLESEATHKPCEGWRRIARLECELDDAIDFSRKWEQENADMMSDPLGGECR